MNDSGQVVKRDNWSNRQSRLDDGQDVQRTRAFFNLVEALDLHPIRVQGMLGNISSRRYLTWKNRPASRISLECARRMESFLRIWEGLLQLFQQEDAARAWLLQPKKVSPFDGLCPIDALSGEGTLHKFEAIVAMFGGIPDSALPEPSDEQDEASTRNTTNSRELHFSETLI